MRTVTYVGLLAIADAINSDWANEKHIALYAFIFIFAAIMDLTDFIKCKQK
jgi:hypothetical protein